MKLRLLIFSLLAVVFCNAQNLVPNSSFEYCTSCPYDYYGQVAKAYPWTSFRMSPDYKNSCNGTFNPVNGSYNIFPPTGGAYCGFIAVCSSCGSDGNGGNSYREWIGAPLCESLIIGQEYFVSLYVLRAGGWGGTCNNIGVRFSTIPFAYDVYPPLPNSAHIYSSAVVTDAINWTKISGVFVADSSYQYIIIGNFFDNAHTLGDGAYYFVDDICVSTDSIKCNYCFPTDSVMICESCNVDTITPPIDTIHIDTTITTSLDTFTMPSAFTPNGDNVNDIFQPVPASTNVLAFRIYNRWGEKVYDASGMGVGWDGKYKGELQPTDVYAYYIEVKTSNGKTENRNGSFTLLR